jgi:mannan endo-1,4-beta-mannosidase
LRKNEICCKIEPEYNDTDYRQLHGCQKRDNYGGNAMKMKMMGFAAALALLLQMMAVSVGAADGQIYEAEDAVMTGALETISESGASGGQVVGKFSESDDVLTFTVEIPSDGSYDLIFNSMGYGGDKTNKVSIDGEYIGTFVTKAEEYNDAVLSKVILTAGKHEVAITKSWGWIAVDYLKVQASEAIPDSAYQVSNVLSDVDATPETKALFTYLCEGYGKQVLSGQVADNGLNSDEFKSIYEVTGKKPAITMASMKATVRMQVMSGNSKAVLRAGMWVTGPNKGRRHTISTITMNGITVVRLSLARTKVRRASKRQLMAVNSAQAHTA